MCGGIAAPRPCAGLHSGGTRRPGPSSFPPAPLPLPPSSNLPRSPPLPQGRDSPVRRQLHLHRRADGHARFRIRRGGGFAAPLLAPVPPRPLHTFCLPGVGSSGNSAIASGRRSCRSSRAARFRAASPACALSPAPAARLPLPPATPRQPPWAASWASVLPSASETRPKLSPSPAPRLNLSPPPNLGHPFPPGRSKKSQALWGEGVLPCASGRRGYFTNQLKVALRLRRAVLPAFEFRRQFKILTVTAGEKCILQVRQA